MFWAVLVVQMQMNLLLLEQQRLLTETLRREGDRVRSGRERLAY